MDAALYQKRYAVLIMYIAVQMDILVDQVCLFSEDIQSSSFKELFMT